MSEESIAESKRDSLSYRVTWVWSWYSLLKDLSSAYPEQVKMDDFWEPYKEWPDIEIIRQYVLLLESFERSLVGSRS